jgi:hypothetical protein
MHTMCFISDLNGFLSWNVKFLNQLSVVETWDYDFMRNKPWRAENERIILPGRTRIRRARTGRGTGASRGPGTVVSRGPRTGARRGPRTGARRGLRTRARSWVISSGTPASTWTSTTPVSSAINHNINQPEGKTK